MYGLHNPGLDLAEGASGPHFPSVADFTMLVAEAWDKALLTTFHAGARQREATRIH